MRAVLSIILAVFAIPMGAPAQDLEFPISFVSAEGQTPDCTSSFVAGLKADGDGFLAVRTGPDTSFPKIDELLNDDIVFICDEMGKWRGVLYRKTGLGEDIRKGWVHGHWLRDLQG
ncbi:MAG: SH3 domain-containing protein [Pseudomonadota bacterium]